MGARGRYVKNLQSTLFAKREGNRDFHVLMTWLVLTGVIIFGFVVAMELGFIGLIVEADTSHISALIFVIYIGFSGHCFWLALGLSTEWNMLRRAQTMIVQNDENLLLSDDDQVLVGGVELPPGVMTDHIRNLVVKAVRHEEPRLDQTLLIQNLAERLRNKQNIGWFVSDALVKLGLLGTIIGFILMLGPVATIEEFDVEHLKRALTAMTGGMAVALFTTLTGLIGSTLLKLQYQIIDKATVSLVDEITETTEVHVVSVLERINAET
jgi:hypothetical protein